MKRFRQAPAPVEDGNNPQNILWLIQLVGDDIRKSWNSELPRNLVPPDSARVGMGREHINYIKNPLRNAESRSWVIRFDVFERFFPLPGC